MEIDTSSSDGNAFAIMGYVHKLFRDTDRLNEWPDVQKRMMQGNYDNVCKVAEEVTFGCIKVVNR